ncbi:transcription factor of the MADS box [Tulasnella sp. JGI-2019a]|nr:transcription factor of the MADS box [Tulasnella sp. JGI-2019a]
MLHPSPTSPTTSVSSTSRKLPESDLNTPEFGLAAGDREPAVAGVGTQASSTGGDGDDNVETEQGKGDDDDDDDLPRGGGGGGSGRRNAKIEFIKDERIRHITFSARKAEILKKAYELSTLTGTQVLFLAVSETGLISSFTTAKLQSLITQPEGKNLIRACLNAPTEDAGPAGGGAPGPDSNGPPGPGPLDPGPSSGEGVSKGSGGVIAPGTEVGASGGDGCDTGFETEGAGPTGGGAPGPPDSRSSFGEGGLNDSGVGGGVGGAIAPGTETSVTSGDGGDDVPEAEHREGDDDDDDDDMPRGGRSQGHPRSGRRDVKIEFIQDKSRRYITFSKRKAEIMKKAYELSTLTGTQLLLLAVSETGLVYSFTTPKLQPLVTQPEGKNLIQACLLAPTEGAGPASEGVPGSNSSGLQDQDLRPLGQAQVKAD